VGADDGSDQAAAADNPGHDPHDGPGITIASVPAVLRLVLLAYVHPAANDGVEFIL
jgi:hypothetical protein